MQDKETGGSAFPRQHTVADANDPSFKLGNEGITLRDYFIAHAPVEPWGWFEPVMPLETEKPPEKRFYAPPTTELRLKNNYECPTRSSEEQRYRQELEKYEYEIGQWKKEKERQRFIQWPAFWADTMLKDRK